MLVFEETRHATAATAVIESLSLDEEEVHTLYNTKYRELWRPKIQFRKLIEPRIDRASQYGMHNYTNAHNG